MLPFCVCSVCVEKLTNANADMPGSGRKILLQDDLKYVDATENQKKELGIADWDDYLSRCRKKLEERKLTAMQTSQKKR